MMAGERRVYTIPPSASFPEVLVQSLVDGTLIPGFRPLDDPLLLSEATLYLPTRRAARNLPPIFQKVFGGRPVLLPDIRPIGDVDETGQLLSEAADGEPLPPSLPPMERHMAMTRLVMAWKGVLRREVLRLKPEDPLGLPASAADAAWLAADLLALMDEIETEEADWSELTSLVPDDYARYWQVTLDFLAIVRETWPAYLSERGAIDAKARRSLLIRREADRIRANPPKGPVIIAGSTGTVPATGELFRAVADLPQGAIVLPGLDQMLDPRAWECLGTLPAPRVPGVSRLFSDDGTRVPSHPQYGLKLLLDRLEVSREDVVPLAKPETPALALRDRLASEAMRPAGTTEGWPEFLQGVPVAERREAMADVALLAARNEVGEAQAVAVALREALERGETAALVSPDRMLARRVAEELGRWNIVVNDSAGRPLDQSPPAVLAALGARLALEGCDPINLLSLLKHPLVRLGLPAKEIRASARALERGVLRGPRPQPGTSGLLDAIEAAEKDATREDSHRPRWKKLREEDWADVRKLAERLAEALAPLEELADTRAPLPVTDIITAHAEVIHRLAVDETGSDAELYAGDAGDALALALGGMLESEEAGLAMEPWQWPSVFGALISGVAVRSRIPGDPRIEIFGPMEARLQRPDLIILGGLNEGVWPQRTRNDPWLNRPMKRDIGLDPPERRIGAAAHDFMQGLGARRVILSRTARADGAPTVTSRWLQRLLTLAGPEVEAEMAERGSRYIHLAERLDKPDGPVRPAARPEPRPPLQTRPHQLSVTQIETLVRDPYAIYAQKVLGLQPVDPIGGAPDASDKGSIIHDALATFLAGWTGPFDQTAVAALLEIGEELFAPLDAFPSIRALWWPRFERIAEAFVEFEARRSELVRKRFLEISGGVDLKLPGFEFRLTGRADRIDLLKDGTLSVIDYKTGMAPSQKQVESLLSPQMPLEGAMIQRQGFTNVPSTEPISELLYIQLKGTREALRLEQRQPKDRDIKELVQDAWERLETLIAAYAKPEHGYLSRARVMQERTFGGEYDHLARVQEWSLGGEEDE